MKLEQSERLYIKELLERSFNDQKIPLEDIVSVDRLTGDASTRRYYRLELKSNCFVICLDNPLAEGEKHKFVEVAQILENAKLRIPKLYDVRLKKGYLLEEDLGDQTLLRELAFIKDAEEELKHYKSAIDNILLMHNISKEDANFVDLFFDYEKLMDEINFSNKYFINSFLGIEEAGIVSEIEEEFKDICKRLTKEKMVFTHRDYHSRNIMIKNNEQIVIDFQDARFGIPQYDLVSLLEDCYYQLDKDNRQELIKYYWNNRNTKLVAQDDFEQFMSLYNDMTLQRVYKAIGSFSYIFHYRQDKRYLKYIGFAMEKLRSCMLSDDKYSQLRKKLFKLYYEN